MYCPKCGDPVEPNEKFCNKCGNPLIDQPSNNELNSVNQFINNQPNINNQYINEQKNNKTPIIIGCISGVIILSVLIFCIINIKNNENEFYFSPDTYETPIEEEPQSTPKTKKGKYQTIIVTDNVYEGVKISTKQDALDLISKDSNDQKKQCPSEIKEIEENIIKEFEITAVNLCEMDVEIAKEIANVFKVVYSEYPIAKKYLTNFTLVNASISEGYIAAFQSIFPFATSDENSKYEMAIKTQILLNTKYYLNAAKLESTMKDASTSGHFPPNTTMYSPVAHEIAHYLSFISTLRYYDIDSILLVNGSNITDLNIIINDWSAGKHTLMMLEEAYSNYKSENSSPLQFDEWRATISKYAVAKDNNGKYIYDETIAEAFHDVYVNGENATLASKYIVEVLKRELGE